MIFWLVFAVGLVLTLGAGKLAMRWRAEAQERAMQDAERNEEIHRGKLFMAKHKAARDAEVAKQRERVLAYRRTNGQLTQRPKERIVSLDEETRTGTFEVDVVPVYGKMEDLTPAQRKRFVKKFDHSTGAKYSDVFDG